MRFGTFHLIGGPNMADVTLLKGGETYENNDL
jgi:hypothetical protein